MNIDILIQARLNSKRFPRKVLAEVGGARLIRYLLTSMAKVTQARHVVVLVPWADKDLIEAVWPWPVWVGDEDDVASRFVEYVENNDCDGFVRVCGDSPLLDWRIVNTMIHLFRTGDRLLVSNVGGGFPHGQQCEVVRSGFFLENKDRLDREHVIPTLYHFTVPWIHRGRGPVEPSLVVDTPADFERIKRVIERANYQPWAHPYQELQAWA